MPDRWGRPIAQDWVGMGAAIGGVIQDQKKAAMQEEKMGWERQDRAEDQQTDKVAALLNDQGEKADLSNFDPISRAKGVAKHAELQTRQFQNSAEGIRLEKEKMGMSLQRIQNIGQRYLSSRAQGDTQGAENAALEFVHHARNGIREVKDLGNGKILLHNMDGTSREIDKPTPEQMDQSIQAYLSDPKIHIQNRLKEKTLISQNNANAAMSPQLWKNDAGQEIVVRAGFIDPETRMPMTQYEDAKTMTPMTEEQVKEGGFKPASIAQDRQKFAEADLNETKAVIGRSNLFQPKDVVKNQAGGEYVETGGGQRVPMSDYTGSNPKQFVPLGKGSEKLIAVNNPVTGGTMQATIKQIRENLKSNLSLLKEVKQDGKTFNFNFEKFTEAPDTKKKTMIEEVENLANDEKQSPRVRDMAGQVLGSVEALGMTSGVKKGGQGLGGSKKQSWKSWAKSQETQKQPEAAVIGN